MMYFSVLSMMLMVFHAGNVSGQEYFPNVTYQDLKDLNLACGAYHNCEQPRYSDDIRYNCNCGDFCSQIDSCCVDSEYRDQHPIERKPYNCVRKYGEHPNPYYHIVDRCDQDWSEDDLTVKLCEGNAEELDNLFLAVPVTNSKSGDTYKNYYCAACNKDADEEELVFWILSLGHNSREFNDSEFPEIHFNSRFREWTYVNEASGEISKVYASLLIPNSVRKHVHGCFRGMISKCAENWNDTEVEAKCQAYMAMAINLQTWKIYRNPHCALCNHEKLEDMDCTWEARGIEKDFGSNTFFVRIFSLYDKTSKCEDDMVYDTLAKKCRKVFKGK